MDNYFERIDFTKIEIILLLGVVLVLSPFLLSPLEYDITKFEEFSDKKLLEKKDFMDAKKIYKTEFVAIDSVNRYENAQKLVLAKFFEDIVIDKEKAKFYENVEIKKEKHKIKTEIEIPTWIENNSGWWAEDVIDDETFVEGMKYLLDKKIINIPPNELGEFSPPNKLGELSEEDISEKNIPFLIQMEVSIYKELKSNDFQNRIFLAFVIAMVILIVSVYLSRKGYTSYTPWLEKLANDKLDFDLKLFQYIDEKELRQFYHTAFKLGIRKDNDPDRKTLEEINDRDVLGWRPLDEDVKWYSVFTEKMDYKFYEIFFENIESEYGDKNYGEETDEKGEWVPYEKVEFKDYPDGKAPKGKRIMNLYKNAELVPKSNNKIKKALRDPIHEEKLPLDCNKCGKTFDRIKIREQKGEEVSDSEFEKYSAEERKKDHKDLIKHMKKTHFLRCTEVKTLFDKIMLEIPIFKIKMDDYEQEKLNKIMIRKIQIDLLYYSVMMNFRRGLVVATEEWARADEKLSKVGLSPVEEDKDKMDLAAQDLKDTVSSIIEKLEKEFDLDGEEKRKKKDLTGEDDVSEEVQNRMKRIKVKMADRNKWNSDDWRAMGSIYYKWREAGKDGSNKKEIDKQGLSRVENFWKYMNFERKKLLKKMPVDPTEEAWTNHRTIRAAHSLSKSFGYEVKEDSGNAVLFFGVVFGLIIAVALTNSLDILIGALQTPLDCDVLNLDIEFDCFHPDFYFVAGNIQEYQYLVILFLCFFPLGILFYHQGTILLSAKAAEQMTLGSNTLVFVNFLFILLQAVVVYFLAASIGDVNSFLSFLILLVTVDAIWVAIFTINDMRDDVRDAPVFIEWIIFDIVIGLFAGIFMINYASTPPILEEDGWAQNFSIFVMLLLVLTTRAVVDYSYGWKNFWSKFAGAE